MARVVFRPAEARDVHSQPVLSGDPAIPFRFDILGGLGNVLRTRFQACVYIQWVFSLFAPLFIVFSKGFNIVADSVFDVVEVLGVLLPQNLVENFRRSLIPAKV
jgi:hypothetical protein